MSAHSSLRRPRKLKNEINVVPYIDVMLVLLVIFMVAAPLTNPGTVELPSVSKSSKPAVAPMEVVIKSDGALAMRMPANATEQAVSKVALVRAIKQAQANNPEQAVVISADKNARYEIVLQVMDELQKQNVKRVGLMVKASN